MKMLEHLEQQRRAALLSRVEKQECPHLLAEVDEVQGWAFCRECGCSFPDDKMVVGDDQELHSYTEVYSSVRNFVKYLRQLHRQDPSLPDWMPLQHGFIRFAEAYNVSKFYRGTKRIGATRNLFGSVYTLYRLALTLAESDPSYQRWAALAKIRLTSPKRLLQLGDHWTQLSVRLPVEWRSRHERFQPLFRPRRGTSA